MARGGGQYKIRMWTAYEGSTQEEILAYLLPVELGFTVNLHLFLIRDLDKFDPANMIDSEIEIRADAIVRLQGFIESGFVSVEKMNILSRLIVHEDLFPNQDESALYLSDLILTWRPEYLLASLIDCAIPVQLHDRLSKSANTTLSNTSKEKASISAASGSRPSR